MQGSSAGGSVAWGGNGDKMPRERAQRSTTKYKDWDKVEEIGTVATVQ
jgi:hypothetical protein